ncbi:MAG: methyl-accepting chemotaxis protein [Actinomycetota bacterium]
MTDTSTPPTPTSRADDPLVGAVAAAAAGVGARLSRLEAAATSLEASARATDSGVTGMTAAMDRSSDDLTGIAASSEQLAATITEVANRVEDSAASSQEASSAVEEATELVVALRSACDEIGSVVESVQNIAKQTNLLALNAAIEAARAGDAGRGFAVVADSVKELAEEAAVSTGQISESIADLRTRAGAATERMGDVHSIVAHVQSSATASAAAVEQQTAATGEIASTIERVATTVSQVNEGLGAVAAEAARVMDDADRTRSVSSMLAAGNDALNDAMALYVSGADGDRAVDTSFTGRISGAIGQHGVWKAKLLHAAHTGEAPWDPSVVEVDDRCVFGTWLHQEIDHRDRDDHWELVRGLHARFHQEAARLLRLAVAGQGRQAEQQMSIGTTYDQLTTDLVLALDDWRADRTG